MSRAGAIGYACVDYAATLDGHFAPDRTVMIRQRASDAFPRPGGCALYAARPLAARGTAVALLSWVGADEHGQLFASSVEQAGIGGGGIVTIEPGSTPMAFMIYQADGSCGCLFDPGILGKEFLSPEQQRLIANAGLCCVTVGPAAITRQALALLDEDCELAWVMKNDPVSFPEPLRIELACRASYIFCNRQERGWVDDALAKSSQSPQRKRQPLVVETAGAEAVRVADVERVFELEVEPLHCEDSTGAGDTLAGGCLAAVLAGERDPCAIVSCGIAAAAALLRSRAAG